MQKNDSLLKINWNSFALNGLLKAAGKSLVALMLHTTALPNYRQVLLLSDLERALRHINPHLLDTAIE